MTFIKNFDTINSVICVKNRTKLREFIIKLIYQIYILEKANVKYDLKLLLVDNIEELDIDKDKLDNNFILESINGILKYQNEITKLANKYLENWTIDRLSLVDKAILSLGIYELMYTKTPNIICINETIEVSKLYSDENVTNMINACMDKIYKEELNGRK